MNISESEQKVNYAKPKRGYDLPENHTVNEIGKMNFSGNVIPQTWFDHIKLENGKTDTVAIIILSDIVYWYRPIETMNEKTGKLEGWRKRFKSDKLQLDYATIAGKFGLTKNQARRATENLVRLGLIDKEFRSFKTENGQMLGNVLFIGLNPSRLKEISYPIELEDDTLSHSNATPIELECDTNTKISTLLNSGADAQKTNSGANALPPSANSEATGSEPVNKPLPNKLPRQKKQKALSKEKFHPALRTFAELTSAPIPKGLQAYIIGMIGETPDLELLRAVYRLACASGKNENFALWLEWYAYRQLTDSQLAMMALPYEYDFTAWQDWKEHPAMMAYKDITRRWPKREIAGMIAYRLGEDPNIDFYKWRFEEWRKNSNYNPANVTGWLFELEPSYLRRAGMAE